MKKTSGIAKTRIQIIFVLATAILISLGAKAAVLSPSSTELRVNFEAEFRTQQSEDANSLVEQHYQHFFGYFHSPTLVKQFNISNIEGIGAPKMPMRIQIVSDVKSSNGTRVIKYKALGEMLLLKKVAQSLLKSKSWIVTMPLDLDNFYEEKCTDGHYNSIGDFWYFYDPFRLGCEYLQNSPLAAQVRLNFSTVADQLQDSPTDFDLMRGDNGNGELFEIVTVNGFAESAKDSEDEGRQAFQDMNDFLLKQGFTEKILAKYQNRPVHQFEKKVKAKDGQVVHFRVTRLLAETSISSANVTFAKFFKKAVETADVVIYAGHSGLGGNLDIPSLEEKAGSFSFNKSKKQLFFFDGCSSYSYYLKTFAERKNKSKLDILTNGLSSLFYSEAEIHSVLLSEIFNLNKNPTWNEVLTKMDGVLDGSTYILNVGAL